jgi:hypothetical protein
LLPEREIEPLEVLVKPIRKQYFAAQSKWRNECKRNGHVLRGLISTLDKVIIRYQASLINRLLDSG